MAESDVSDINLHENMQISGMAETDALLDNVDSFSSSANGHACHGSDTDGLIKAGRTKKENKQAPIDRRHFVYIVFYIFGMCSVLPWNMFITAQNYFDYKYRQTNITPTADSSNSTTSPPTELQSMFESYFSVAAAVPNVIMQLVNTGIKHKVTLKARMITSLSGMLLIFIFTTIMTRVNTDLWQTDFFILTIVSVVLINCFSAVFQGSVFGLGGLLSMKYTQALMAGQGLGGIVPALVSIICLATLHSDAWVGFVYFLISVLCIIITYGAYLALPRNRFAEYYLNKQAGDFGIQDTSGASSRSFEFKKTAKPPFWLIFKKIWIPAIMVFLTFTVTLGNYPGVTSQIESMHHNHFSSLYFTPIFCFLLFNTMDYVGRSLSWIEWPSRHHLGLLSFFVLLRLGFFPLFALCNANPLERHSDVVFTHDAFFIVFIVFFGLSNGYLGSLCMMYGPKCVAEEYQETAGNMMAFFLVLGLAVGSLLSIAVLHLL